MSIKSGKIGISQHNIIDAILRGMNKAHQVQWRRCSGAQQYSPAESIYLVKVADAVANAGIEYMNYEYKLRLLREELGISSSANIRNGRVDLLLRNKPQRPLAIIEIKSEYATEKALKKDIERICALLDNRNKIEIPDLFGVFAVALTRYSGTKDVRDSFTALEDYIVTPTVASNGCTYRTHLGAVVGKRAVAWGSCCFEINLM